MGNRPVTSWFVLPSPADDARLGARSDRASSLSFSRSCVRALCCAASAAATSGFWAGFLKDSCTCFIGFFGGGAASRSTAGGDAPPAQSLDHTSADTMYLTVADSEGTMVSLIQSNYEGFGSGLVVPSLGFGLQDRGSLFNMAKGSANQYMPGKRPFHTIIPGFATRRDANGTEQPWMSFGVMGGNIQPQGHAQILTNIIDFGMNPQEAGDAARYTHSGSSQPTGQVMDDGGTVQLEGGVCAGVRAELKARGHRLTAGANGGGYQSITLENGVYVGASEMRKDGMAAGY